jgi:hypothetical protein
MRAGSLIANLLLCSVRYIIFDHCQNKNFMNYNTYFTLTYTRYHLKYNKRVTGQKGQIVCGSFGIFCLFNSSTYVCIDQSSSLQIPLLSLYTVQRTYLLLHYRYRTVHYQHFIVFDEAPRPSPFLHPFPWAF